MKTLLPIQRIVSDIQLFCGGYYYFAPSVSWWRGFTCSPHCSHQPQL